MTIRGFDAESYRAVAEVIGHAIRAGNGAPLDSTLRERMTALALAHPIPFG